MALDDDIVLTEAYLCPIYEVFKICHIFTVTEVSSKGSSFILIMQLELLSPVNLTYNSVDNRNNHEHQSYFVYRENRFGMSARKNTNSAIIYTPPQLNQSHSILLTAVSFTKLLKNMSEVRERGKSMNSFAYLVTDGLFGSPVSAGDQAPTHGGLPPICSFPGEGPIPDRAILSVCHLFLIAPAGASFSRLRILNTN